MLARVNGDMDKNYRYLIASCMGQVGVCYLLFAICSLPVEVHVPRCHLVSSFPTNDLRSNPIDSISSDWDLKLRLNFNSSQDHESYDACNTSGATRSGTSVVVVRF